MTGRTAAAVQSAGRRRGFTLLELLVALTLLGLLSVALFGGLRFGARAWEAGNARVDRLADVEVAQAFLRRHLSQATVPLTSAQGARGPDVFDGEANRLRFTAPVAPHFGVGGLYLLDLAVVDQDRRPRLELWWHLYRPDEVEGDASAQNNPLSGERTLIDGIEGVSLSYFGAAKGEREAQWHDTWNEGPRLPELISLKVAFPAGDPRTWPLLVVAPRKALSGSEP